MLYLIVSAILLLGCATDPRGDFLTTTRLSEDVLVLTVSKGYWNVNSAAVATGEGLVVIDTFNLPQYAKAALEKIKEFSDEPPRFVINTHCHADHAFGNVVFTEATIIGYCSCGNELEGEAARIRLGVESGIETFENALRKAVPGSDQAAKIENMLDFLRSFKAVLDGGFTPAKPEVEFSKAATLVIGDKTFEMLYVGPIHSATDIAVSVPEEKLIFTSDIFHPDQDLQRIRGA